MKSPQDGPRASVVVATHNRPELLRTLLEAIRAQSMTDFQLVVVDDGSDDTTPNVAALADVVVRTDHVGPARARQAGWQVTDGPIIAFTDDDCRPQSQWLERLVETLEQGDAGLAQGRTVPRSDQADRHGPWSRTQHIETESGFYQTCNIAYTRTALEAVGGFHPAFSGPRTSGEDTDLAWRVKEQGYRSVFVAEAVVEHEVWPSSYAAFLKDRPRWGMVVLTLRHHPQLRRLAYRRYFYRPSHARALAGLGVIGLAAAWHPWLAPTLCAGAATLYVGRGPSRPKRLVHLGQVALADLYELAVFVVASARYRTVLL